jgi:hypothetical protein
MKIIYYTVDGNNISFYKEKSSLPIKYAEMEPSRFLYDLNKQIGKFKENDKKVTESLSKDYKKSGKEVFIERDGIFRKVVLK